MGIFISKFYRFRLFSFSSYCKTNNLLFMAMEMLEKMFICGQFIKFKCCWVNEVEGAYFVFSR